MDPIDPEQSEFENALLRAGRNVSMSPELRNKTLAALGVGVAVGVTTTSVAKAGTLGWLSGKAGVVVAATGLVGALGVAGAVALSGGFSSAAREAGPTEVERSGDAAVTARLDVDEAPAKADPGASASSADAIGAPAGGAVVPSPGEGEIPQEKVRGAATEEERSTPRAAPAQRDSSPAEPSGLREELSHIARVEAALQGGEPGRALSLLAEYRRRFPRPRLGLEAEVLTIQALSENGSRSAARKRAERFLEKHPTSPLGARAKRYLE